MAIPEVRDELYEEKQKILRAARAAATGVPVEVALTAVDRQKARWRERFGRFTEVWHLAVVPILEANNVPKLMYALYKAFTNQYISKVLIKGTETPELVKTKFTNLGADAGILDEITAKIGEVF